MTWAKPKPSSRISFDDEQTKVHWDDGRGRSGTHRIAWHEVTKSIAYKRDLYVVDLICLDLESSNLTVSFHEEMEGWEPFLDVLPSKLPGFWSKDRIYSQVMQPPFAAKSTLIYRAGERAG